MNIHIINPYGTLADESWRKYRANIVAEQLSANGYNVVLWISNIDHRSKLKRSDGGTKYIINSNYKIRVVKSTQYNKNASFGRILYERNFAKNVRKVFANENISSDCIIISDPCIFYGDIVLDLVRKTKSKFIIDILDIWPEVFITLFNKYLKVIVNIVLFPLYLQRKYLYNTADGIVAVTKDYLDIALKVVENIPSEVVYIGIDFNDVKLNNKLSQDYFDLSKSPNEKWIIYAGTLGLNYDIKTLMQFAERIETDSSLCKLIIAGDGPMKGYIQNIIYTKNLQKTIFFGRLEVSELNSLYSLCDISLSTYLSTSTVSMPVKVFDYISFGLPIVNSLERELGELIQENNIGKQYIPENVNSLYNSINELLLDNHLLETMKYNALNISKQFSFDNQYIKYIRFVDKICNKIER